MSAAKQVAVHQDYAGYVPTYKDVEAAAERLEGIANKTPVMKSRILNKQLDAEVFFKCENFQRMGSFKFRGGYNALCNLND
jgi:threonine dehydratase